MRTRLIDVRVTLIVALALVLVLPPFVGMATDTRSLNEQLIEATARGNVELVSSFLDKETDVNARGQYEWTPLMWAAERGHLKVVKALLDKGADPNAKEEQDWTPLAWAAERGHSEVVKALLDKGADANAKVAKGQTALTMACARGHADVVKVLSDNGAEVNQKTDDGRTALMWAAYRGDLKVVRMLLDKGADVHAKDNVGSTALMGASKGGHPAVVEMLLKKGADVNSAGTDGSTALMSAAKEGHLDVSKLLLDNGADVNARKGRWTALMYAAAGGHAEVVRLLLDKGADVYVGDEEDRKALMNALRRGDLEQANGLIAKAVGKGSQTIDLFDLIAYFMIPASASYTVLPWPTLAQPGFSVEWKTEGTKPKRPATDHVREGEVSVTITDEDPDEVSSDQPWKRWKIELVGGIEGVREIKIWREMQGGCVDLESELRDRLIPFKLYKCEAESHVTGGEKIYEIHSPGKKRAWLYYMWSSGSGGCWGDFALLFNKEDADHVGLRPDLVTDCRKDADAEAASSYARSRCPLIPPSQPGLPILHFP